MAKRIEDDAGLSFRLAGEWTPPWSSEALVMTRNLRIDDLVDFAQYPLSDVEDSRYQDTVRAGTGATC